jgi:single-strand DNA-binding protein
MNVVVLQGSLSRPPEPRALPSGDLLVNYEVTVPAAEDRRAESVPVCWFDAPAGAADLEPDSEVVVVGRVRRRFFRAGGSTQSRTEVVAEHVVPVRQAKKAQRAVLGALQVLEERAAS